MKKLVAIDPPYVLPEYLEQIRNIEGLEYIQHDDFDRTEEGLVNRGENAEILLIDPTTQYPAKILERLKKLEALITTSVGMDHIDLEYCKKNNIKVINFPGYNANSVAEMTFALMLTLIRNIVLSNNKVKEGKWKEGQSDGTELLGKSLGLIGAGNIGKNLIRIANGFGMDVLVNTKNPSDDRAAVLGISSFKELDYVYENADFLVVAIPLTDETENMINSNTLQRMKPSSYLINVGRGGVVDTKDLYEALKNGKIAGAAVDVINEEPLNENKINGFVKDLLDMDNFIITPHIAGSTIEANHRMGQRIVETIKSLLLFDSKK